MTDGDTPCPHCGESIKAVAIKCRYCGQALDKEAVARQREGRVVGPAPPLLKRKVSCMWCGMGLVAGLLTAAVLAVGNADNDMLAVGGIVALAVALALMVRDVANPRRKVLLDSYSFLGSLVLIVGASAVTYLALDALIDSRRPNNPISAIGSLKTIGTAQSLYRESDREGDGNLDYGTLAELANAGTSGLIDSVLGSGTKTGYLFEVTYGASTSEFLWFATARPAAPGVTGDRYFCTNHEGVIFYTHSGAFSLNSVDCTVPPTVQPIGK